jgi:uncharacterized protein (DUF433 family)
MAAHEIMPTGPSWIEKNPGVCGGDACIRRMRFPVWQLVEARRLGISDETLLEHHPNLTPADLDVAWRYYSEHPQEIEQAIWENDACMLEHEEADSSSERSSWIVKYPDAERGYACVRNTPIPVWFLVRGRQLGLSDERIRDAFFPPLGQGDLDAAWAYSDQHHPEIESDMQQGRGV